MLKFTYTKPNGEVSERVAIVVHEPSDNFLMLDLTELEPLEMAIIEKDYAEYSKELKMLREKYNLNYYFKNFKATRMSDIEKC